LICVWDQQDASQITSGGSKNFGGFSIYFAYKKPKRTTFTFFPIGGPFMGSFISDLVYLPGDLARAKGRSVLNLLKGKCPEVC